MLPGSPESDFRGRVSRQQAERHRRHIVETAARLFRERGVDAVSVSEIMTAAGTHGGFYGHFASKDALAAEACGQAFAESQARWNRRISTSAGRHAALKRIADAYLAEAHRDSAGLLCAAAAFAGTVDRQEPDKPIHERFTAGFDTLVTELSAVYATETDDRRGPALAAVATMTGALMLARATRGEPVSDEILQAAREKLLGQ